MHESLGSSCFHVLLHRNTPWHQEIHCSTQIYAEYFLKAGHRVTYMQGMSHAGRLLASKGNASSWWEGPRREDQAWVFTPLSIVPYMSRRPLRSSLAADLAYLSCVPDLKAQVKRSGNGLPDVIWTARPGSGALKRIFPDSLLVFQVVDYYPAYRGEYIKDVEREDYQRADHLFLIGHSMVPYLVEELGVLRSKITVLGQGVALGEYKQDREIPDDLARTSSPRAIWVGVLEKGDARLFEAAAESIGKRGGSLVLVGPEAKWAEDLQHRYSNVHVLGARAPSRVPSYLCHSDVGLMLYDQSRQQVYRGQNPLKLYEYAAAGLSILSTPHEEFEYLDPPVIEVCEVKDVAEAIDHGLEQRDQWREDALNFVSDRSWTSRFMEAEGKIMELLE